MAPILLIGAGLIVAFRGSLWNLGGNGQYLLAFAVVAGIAPGILTALPPAIGWVVLCLVAIAVGAAWTLVPSLLKVRYGLNEIVTSLMMTFIGVSLANLLIKGPFRGPTVIPQTLVVDPSQMFMNLPGTRIHIGVILALVVVVVVHLVLTRSSFGTRLDVLGANPRAALHLGIDVPRMIVGTFLISGGLIGFAAAVDMLGIFGYMRADWDPDYALKVVPLVFLARLNVIAVIPFAAFFGVLSIGGDYAARKADVPNVFLLLVVGLILLFMVVTQYLSDKRARGEPLLPARLRGPRRASSTTADA
jgi:simple sugar transport system permease protein